MLGIGLAVALCTGPAAAQAPIREFDIATIEALGRAIHRQDSAAWVATDALLPRIKDPKAVGLQGWITEDKGRGVLVRFLRDVGQGLEAGWDVEVARDLSTRISEPTDRTLTADEKAKFAARQTSARGLERVCRAGYNTAVVKDPDGDGWLVWQLAPIPKAGTLAVGGHYRFTVSADGQAVERRDALSNSCLVLDPSAAGVPADATSVTPGMNHVVSPTPVETHVFAQLQWRGPIMVMAGGRIWKLDKGRITNQGPAPQRP